MADLSSRGRGRFKRTANRGRGRGYPPYDTFKFDSEYASQIFDDHISTKTVVVERYVKFNDVKLQTLGLVPEFRRRGWEKFLTQTGQACVDIVREFYANITTVDRQSDGPRIVSKLRGQPFIIGPDDFESILGLPVVEDTDFHLDHIKYSKEIMVGLISHNNSPWLDPQYKHTNLKDQYRLLHLVTCSSLIPQKRTSDLSVDRASLMCAVMSNKKVDVRRLIGDVIYKHWKQVHHPGALPYGLFITKVAKARGIQPTIEDNMIDPECQIDESTLNRSKLQKKQKRRTHANVDPDGDGSSVIQNVLETVRSIQASHDREHELDKAFREEVRVELRSLRAEQQNFFEFVRRQLLYWFGPSQF